ncbi:MAG: protein-export chaperone SecB [Clostridia bacterium]|nr:protein-export chaperone SecB [Clostridia bacterium]
MAKIQLRTFRVNELTFVNKVEPETKINLNFKYGYQVAHRGGNASVGEMTLTISDKTNPEKFNIKVVLLGYFAIDGEITKEAVHSASFKDLFPYMRSIVTSITVNCGMPPIVPPAIDIDGQPVYRVDK